MKKTLLALALAGAASVSNAAETNLSLETQIQKVSYGFGLVLGKRMTNDMPELEIDIFVQGMKDAFAGKSQLLTDEQIGELLSTFQREQQQKQIEKAQQSGEENKQTGEAFLKTNKDSEGVVTLESGLQYKILIEGKGIQPSASDVVKVHYTGSFINGEVFDSSLERGPGGVPAVFPVNGVISGWTEALQLMPTGSKWQLFIPSNLAYGPTGNRSIGPNETLLFEVELLEVEKKK